MCISINYNNDLTITNKATSLVWEQNDFQSSDFENAISSCETSTTENYDDWRLPNVKELQSTVDYTRSLDTTSRAAINPIFNATSFINEEGEKDASKYYIKGPQGDVLRIDNMARCVRNIK